MNLCIWSKSKDESDAEEYMEFSNKYCIGYISSYTSGDYVYFNDMTDKPKTSYWFNIESETWQVYNITIDDYGRNICIFANPICQKVQYKWMNANIQIVAQLLKVNVWKNYNQQMEQMCN